MIKVQNKIIEAALGSPVPCLQDTLKLCVDALDGDLTTSLISLKEKYSNHDLSTSKILERYRPWAPGEQVSLDRLLYLVLDNSYGGLALNAQTVREIPQAHLQALTSVLGTIEEALDTYNATHQMDVAWQRSAWEDENTHQNESPKTRHLKNEFKIANQCLTKWIQTARRNCEILEGTLLVKLDKMEARLHTGTRFAPDFGKTSPFSVVLAP